MAKITIDTNVLMSKPYILCELIKEHDIIIPIVILEELDNINHRRNGEASFQARRAIKEIFKCIDGIQFDSYFRRNKKNDNLIIKVAKRNKSMLMTLDVAMTIKAKAKKIEIFEYNDTTKHKREYKGYQILELDLQDERDEFLLSSLYSGNFDIYESDIEYDFLENEYLIVKDVNKNEYVDAFKFVEGKFETVIRRDLKCSYYGTVKTKDIFQTISLDSMFENQITMVKGTAGTGKSFLGINYALKQVKDNKFDKIIFFVNPTPAKGAQELGFYPGSRIEKLIETSVGATLSSKFGGREGLLRLIEEGDIEILPFVDIRGYDTSGMKAIIYFMEAQNLDIELMKLGLQRIGDDCKAILDGDYKTQTDKDMYSNGNNGMRRMAEIFRGSSIYGEIELKTIYRSKIAGLADLM